MKDLLKVTRRFFRKNSDEILKVKKAPIETLEQSHYTCLVKAAYSKSIEYSHLLVNKRNINDAFILSPFLRGICEDLISLSYIKKTLDTNTRDLISGQYGIYLQYSSIAAQQFFFKKEAPYQDYLSLKNPEETLIKLKDNLNVLWEKQGQNKNKLFPSVEHMSIDTKYKALYDFLYHASSKTVHFSPNILLRTGWYNVDNLTTQTPTSEVIFSTNNFNKYYHHFNTYYSLYLLVQFTNNFKKELLLSKNYLTDIKAISESLSKSPYPELVTYEEMNMKRPSSFFNFIKRYIQ